MGPHGPYDIWHCAEAPPPAASAPKPPPPPNGSGQLKVGVGQILLCGHVTVTGPMVQGRHPHPGRSVGGQVEVRGQPSWRVNPHLSEPVQPIRCVGQFATVRMHPCHPVHPIRCVGQGPYDIWHCADTPPPAPWAPNA